MDIFLRICSHCNHQGNADQATTRHPLTPVRITNIKETIITNAGEDVGEREPSDTAGGNASWVECKSKTAISRISVQESRIEA